jgi:hypothetical protein
MMCPSLSEESTGNSRRLPTRKGQTGACANVEEFAGENG